MSELIFLGGGGGGRGGGMKTLFAIFAIGMILTGTVLIAYQDEVKEVWEEIKLWGDDDPITTVVTTVITTEPVTTTPPPVTTVITSTPPPTGTTTPPPVTTTRTTTPPPVTSTTTRPVTTTQAVTTEAELSARGEYGLFDTSGGEIRAYPLRIWGETGTDVGYFISRIDRVEIRARAGIQTSFVVYVKVTGEVNGDGVQHELTRYNFDRQVMTLHQSVPPTFTRYVNTERWGGVDLTEWNWVAIYDRDTSGYDAEDLIPPSSLWSKLGQSLSGYSTITVKFRHIIWVEAITTGGALIGTWENPRVSTLQTTLSYSQWGFSTAGSGGIFGGVNPLWLVIAGAGLYIFLRRKYGKKKR
jgi:hypothetical protein